jgi:hypothetical protein
MATSTSFHGVVGLQNGSRHQIDKMNYLQLRSPSPVHLQPQAQALGAFRQIRTRTKKASVDILTWAVFD